MSLDLVLFELDLPAREIESLAASLDEGEQVRAAAYRSPRDRRRFIARRGQLRRLLAERLGGMPHRLQFRSNPWGKPFLAEQPSLHFSLSSSGELALFASAWGREVGCDIERKDPALALPGVAQRFFSPAEQEALASLADEQWVDGFFNCWTRKEAYVKALGLGLSCPLDGFTVSVAPGESGRLIDAEPGWSLCSFAPAPRYQAAVVLRGEAADVGALACRGLQPTARAA
ncbi:4'-phosphopantetheinyl transferase superfamily protein [Sphingomonas parva]|uniref:4'-phosphopantetheinyl transferase superfamily protein n=1 Tax=Sphingomonas parva TaxID=2555898 RepID=A0A4Y8ZUM2_9SPHN|nr:4'-phosphopantetheinyl transferase superfamily protein [Sphingomonas parva]TFI59012.1 4'-phosphopantetheinyl transferase superfamily protein [Sphingomonas parva]